jgi:tetratricopeptide (TPR) repeat protein
MRVRLQGVDVPSDVQAPLLVLSEVLKGGPGITSLELAHAAVKVSRWAGEQDLPHTAISFAQAAALLLPGRADLSYKVGLLCRTNGQYARAETWFRRTIVLARRRGDAHSYAMSWNSLGNLYMRRGQHQAAELAFVKALRKSRRSGILSAKAMALHNLFCVAVETGRIAEAEYFARKAANAYKPADATLVVLAHDVAALWRTRGFNERALSVFQAVIPLLRNPAERVQALSSLARAAGGAGSREVFLKAWVEAWAIIDRYREMESLPAALLNLSYASAALLDWERAELASHQALLLSRERKEEQVQQEAEEVFAAVSERRLEEKLGLEEHRAAEDCEASDLLARKLVQKLEICARRMKLSPRTGC